MQRLTISFRESLDVTEASKISLPHSDLELNAPNVSTESHNSQQDSVGLNLRGIFESSLRFLEKILDVSVLLPTTKVTVVLMCYSVCHDIKLRTY